MKDYKMQNGVDFAKALAKLISENVPLDEKKLARFLKDSPEFESLMINLLETMLAPSVKPS